MLTLPNSLEKKFDELDDLINNKTTKKPTTNGNLGSKGGTQIDRDNGDDGDVDEADDVDDDSDGDDDEDDLDNGNDTTTQLTAPESELLKCSENSFEAEAWLEHTEVEEGMDF